MKTITSPSAAKLYTDYCIAYRLTHKSTKGCMKLLTFVKRINAAPIDVPIRVGKFEFMKSEQSGGQLSFKEIYHNIKVI